MIRNEIEYQEALRRIKEDEEVMHLRRQEFQDMGLDDEQMQRAMAPLITFHKQLLDELDWYDRVKRGDIQTLMRITDLGKGLIALRIASGLTQRDLAQRLGINESQISRDERNDYHGITIDRAQRIIDAIQGRIEIRLSPQEPQLERELATV